MGRNKGPTRFGIIGLIALPLLGGLALAYDTGWHEDLISAVLEDEPDWQDKFIREVNGRRIIKLTVVTPPPPGPAEPQPAESAGAADYYPALAGAVYTYRRFGEGEKTIVRYLEVEQRDGITFLHSNFEKFEKVSPPHDQIYTTGIGGNFETWISDGEVYRMLDGAKDVLMRLPPKEGESWSMETNGITFTRTVVSTDASVITPAGIFKHCVEIGYAARLVVADGPPLAHVTHSFYAPNVGLVKTSFKDPKWHDEGFELVSYEPPADPH